MIFISILIFIMAIAIPSLKNQLSPVLLSRMTTIILLYSGVLSFNAFYIQSIGSGIGLYSGLFHVTNVSQLLDTFILIIGALILIPRPNNIIKPSTVHASPAVGQVASSYSEGAVTPRLVSEAQETNGLLRVRSSAFGTEALILLESESILGVKYSLIILFSILGSILLISSADLVSMYLSIELQSFGVYILSTLFRDNKSATSAGLKYFLLGGFSSCLILLGSALVYSYTGLTNLDNIYMLSSVSTLTQGSFALGSQLSSVNIGLLLGVSIIIVGYLFKVSAAPLHNWAPDVYDDSPTIVTIWLTIMPKISILMFLLDLYIGVNPWPYLQSTLSESISNISNLITLGNQPFAEVVSTNILGNLLLVSSLLSLIIGTIVGLAQTKIKRLLAYSTISHIGFILLALSITSEQSIESFIFYVIVYTITNLNTFMIILALGYLIKYSYAQSAFGNAYQAIDNRDIKFITELKGQFNSNPLLSIALAICLFSMAGVPPLLGFFSKQMVLYSAIQNGYIFMSIIAILTSVISASYYLKIVRILFTIDEPIPNIIGPASELASKGLNLSADTSVGSYAHNVSEVNKEISSVHSFIISTLTLFILLFILKPSILLNSTQLLSLSIFNC